MSALCLNISCDSNKNFFCEYTGEILILSKSIEFHRLVTIFVKKLKQHSVIWLLLCL